MGRELAKENPQEPLSFQGGVVTRQCYTCFMECTAFYIADDGNEIKGNTLVITAWRNFGSGGVPDNGKICKWLESHKKPSNGFNLSRMPPNLLIGKMRDIYEDQEGLSFAELTNKNLARFSAMRDAVGNPDTELQVDGEGFHWRRHDGSSRWWDLVLQ